ncbi:MAG TPA: phosphatase PAP2 family protein [bacterium]|nr:phosphatase PAP2 family protein [bacterium]
MNPLLVNSARLGAALVLCVVVAAATFLLPSHGWDVAVTRWLQHQAAPTADQPAAVFVFLDDAEVLIPAVAFVGLLLWWRRDRVRSAGALRLAIGLAAVSTIAFALKFMVPHPGPPPDLQRTVARYGIGVAQPFSFPSGHTMRITFFATSVLRRAPAAAGALVVAMMAALVYLGEHWTSDVLGGLGLGWACAEIAARVRGRAGRTGSG